MRRILVALPIVAACALAAVVPGSAVADPTGTCPDHMTPTPAYAVNNGFKKDKNGDGFVCAKPAPSCVATDTCNGGRDADVFGMPLLGVDGNWYYVADNTLP